MRSGRCPTAATVLLISLVDPEEACGPVLDVVLYDSGRLPPTPSRPGRAGLQPCTAAAVAAVNVVQLRLDCYDGAKGSSTGRCRGYA
jgi:hypothetical protein